MTFQETQDNNREELLAQLQAHDLDISLRIWLVDYDKQLRTELEFAEVKFEGDEIIVELYRK